MLGQWLVHILEIFVLILMEIIALIFGPKARKFFQKANQQYLLLKCIWNPFTVFSFNFIQFFLSKGLAPL